MQGTGQLPRTKFIILPIICRTGILLQKGDDGLSSILDMVMTGFVKSFIDCVIDAPVDGEFLFTPFGEP